MLAAAAEERHDVRREEVVLHLRRDRAEQRRPEQDPGEHLAHHARLAEPARAATPTSRAARITTAIASISRPNVSSAERFSAASPTRPARAAPRRSVTVTSSPPTVPVKAGSSPSLDREVDVATLLPSLQVTSPVRRSSSQAELAAGRGPSPSRSTNWPDWVSSTSAEAGVGRRRVDARDLGRVLEVAADRDRDDRRDDEEDDHDGVADEQPRADATAVRSSACGQSLPGATTNSSSLAGESAREHLRVGAEDLTDEAVEDASGAELEERRHAGGGERAHALDPAHRARDLVDERLPHLLPPSSSQGTARGVGRHRHRGEAGFHDPRTASRCRARPSRSLRRPRRARCPWKAAADLHELEVDPSGETEASSASRRRSRT